MVRQVDMFKPFDYSRGFCYYAHMECPICKKPLRLASDDESNNPKTGAKYDRRVYVCDKDDVWLTLEEPKTK